jgi:hypothetical protein
MPRVGFRTHDPNVRAREDSSCLRPRSHCDWRCCTIACSYCMCRLVKHFKLIKLCLNEVYSKVHMSVHCAGVLGVQKIYRQTLASPGKLKIIYSMITWSVGQSVLLHRVWYKLLLCCVLCLYDSCESVSNQPALWTSYMQIFFSYILYSQWSETWGN